MRYLKYIACVGMLLVSCTEKHSSEQTKDQKQRIVAQIFADPAFVNIAQELTDVYESINDSVDFQVVSLSEELAIQKFMKDSAVAVIVSKQLQEGQLAQLDTHQKSGKEYLFAQDAVAFVVNRADSDSVFSRDEVLQLLTKNPKGKNIVFDVNHSSSLGYINRLLGKDTLHASSFATKNTEELFAFIAANKNAIGVIGSNVFSNMEDSVLTSQFTKVKLVGIRAEKQIFYPFQADIAAQKYPFARNIYILNSEHYYGKYSGFKNFVIGPTGQRIILKAGLLPANMPNRLLNFVKKRESAP